MKLYLILGLIYLASAATTGEDSEGNTYEIEATGTAGSQVCSVSKTPTEGEALTLALTTGAGGNCVPVVLLIDSEDNPWVGFEVPANDVDADAVDTSGFTQNLFDAYTGDQDNIVIAMLNTDDLKIAAGTYLFSQDEGEDPTYGDASLEDMAICNGTLLALEGDFGQMAPAEGANDADGFSGIGTTATNAWIVIDVSDDSAWEIVFSEVAGEDNEPVCETEDGEDTSAGILAIVNLALVALGLLSL